MPAIATSEEDSRWDEMDGIAGYCPYCLSAPGGQGDGDHGAAGCRWTQLPSAYASPVHHCALVDLLCLRVVWPCRPRAPAPSPAEAPLITLPSCETHSHSCSLDKSPLTAIARIHCGMTPILSRIYAGVAEDTSHSPTEKSPHRHVYHCRNNYPGPPQRGQPPRSGRALQARGRAVPIRPSSPCVSTRRALPAVDTIRSHRSGQPRSVSSEPPVLPGQCN